MNDKELYEEAMQSLIDVTSWIEPGHPTIESRAKEIIAKYKESKKPKPEEICKVCGSTMRLIWLNGTANWWCNTCQTKTGAHVAPNPPVPGGPIRR